MRDAVQIGRYLAAGLVLGLLLLSASNACAAHQPKPRKLAFLVGIKKYQHAKLHDLEFAERDVEELADLLIGQGFSVRILTTGLAAKNPSRMPDAANIRRQLAEFLKSNKVTKQDAILVGLAGHGLQPLGSNESYFCPRNANPTVNAADAGKPGVLAEPDTLISIGEMLREIDDSGIGVKLVLVDACRNDPGVRGRRSGSVSVNVNALPDQTGVLLSCKAGEFSFEHNSLGGGHGVFFYHIIEGLRGAACDEEQKVSFDGLSQYARKHVPAQVQELYGKDGGEQHPNMISNLSGEPFTLAVGSQPPARQRPREPGKELVAHGAAGGRPSLLTAPFDAKQAQASQKEWAKHVAPGEVMVTNKIDMKMMLIPPGEFEMGSSEDPEDLILLVPKDRRRMEGDDFVRTSLQAEQPAHRVRLSCPFYLSKYEVTKGQFRAFADKSRYRTSAEMKGDGGWGWIEGKIQQRYEFNWRTWGVNQKENSPVVNVCWKDAQKFCAWLSGIEKKKYRLPTEAEWEYACRAGTTTRFYNGSAWDRIVQVGNIADTAAKGLIPSLDVKIESRDGMAFTCAVGQFLPNAWGIYDMHGNACEWCSDWYSSRTYGETAGGVAENPQGPPSGSVKVCRGGSWGESPIYSRSSARDSNDPAYRGAFLGFRVVMEP